MPEDAVLLEKNKFNNLFFVDEKNFIIINSFFGTIDLISESVMERFVKDSLTDKEKNYFTEKGYYKNNLKEKETIKKLEEEASKIKSKAFFVISLSQKCNLNCPSCYEKNRRTEHKMSFEILENVLRKIDSFVKNNKIREENVEIFLFGGEPLLNENEKLVEKSIHEIVKRGYKWGVITNGTELKNYRKIFEKFKKKEHLIRISIEGPDFIQDSIRFIKRDSSYKIVFNELKYFTKNGFNVMATSTAGRSSFHFIPKLLKEFKKHGFFSLKNFTYRIMPVTDHGYNGALNEVVSPGELFGFLSLVGIKHESVKKKIKIEYSPHLELLSASLGVFYCPKTPKIQYCGFGFGNAFLFSSKGEMLHCARCENREENEIIFSENENILYEKIKKLREIVVNKKGCEECSLSLLCGGGCSLNQIICKGLEKNCFEERSSDIQLFISCNKELIIDLKKDSITSISSGWDI